MREQIKDDGKALKHLHLFADLGGELEGRLEVIANDWNEPKTLGEDIEDLPRLTDARHRNRTSANSTGATERGQDQAEKGTRSDRARSSARAGPGWRLLPFFSASKSASFENGDDLSGSRSPSFFADAPRRCCLIPLVAAFEHELEPPPALHLVFIARPSPAPHASPRALEPCLLVPMLSMRRPRPQAEPILPTRLFSLVLRPHILCAPVGFPSSRPTTVAFVNSVLHPKLIRVSVCSAPRLLSPSPAQRSHPSALARRVQPRALASVTSRARPPPLCASLRVMITCHEVVLMYVFSLCDNPQALA
jgi:hypothetical protein